MKNEILKYLGIVVLLVGVILLAVYQFGGNPTNGLLIAAGACVVAGTIGHIILNKVID